MFNERACVNRPNSKTFAFSIASAPNPCQRPAKNQIFLKGSGVEKVFKAARSMGWLGWAVLPHSRGVPNTLPSNAGYLVLVVDDSGAGPELFNSNQLRSLLKNAEVVVCSISFYMDCGDFVADLMKRTKLHGLVLVLTKPEWHEAWANKVIELSGAPPRPNSRGELPPVYELTDGSVIFHDDPFWETRERWPEVSN
jgi:hypothetical protein